MLQKRFPVLLTLLLSLLPYSNILSGFAPYLSEHSFSHYLVASAALMLVFMLLGVFLFKRRPRGPFTISGWLFFLTGPFIAPALMMGPPDLSPALLQHIPEEHFRFTLLLIATVLLTAGFVALLKPVWALLSGWQRWIVIPFIVSVVLLCWDFYSSYTFSRQLSSWTGSGKNAADFFPAYNFNEMLRTGGRSLVYITLAGLSGILFRMGKLKKWIAVLLAVFCFTGIVFFFLFNFLGPQFYFPFMIPAVAFAPVYWLGMALLGKAGAVAVNNRE